MAITPRRAISGDGCRPDRGRAILCCPPKHAWRDRRHRTGERKKAALGGLICDLLLTCLPALAPQTVESGVPKGIRTPVLTVKG